MMRGKCFLTLSIRRKIRRILPITVNPPIYSRKYHCQAYNSRSLSPREVEGLMQKRLECLQICVMAVNFKKVMLKTKHLQLK